MSIAIKNLVNNSLKYSPDYSPVELRLWKTGEKIFFEIEDYGCGTKKYKSIFMTDSIELINLAIQKDLGWGYLSYIRL